LKPADRDGGGLIHFSTSYPTNFTFENSMINELKMY